MDEMYSNFYTAVPNVKFAEVPTKGLDGRFHFVYCTVNRVTSKFYIGKCTSSEYPTDYVGSGAYLWCSINKHGLENFVSTPIRFFDTSDEAYQYEKELLTLEVLKCGYCYNLSGGGKGFPTGDLHHEALLAKEGKSKWQLNNPSTDRVRDGTHVFLTRPDGTNVNTDRVADGSHPFLARSDGSSIGSDMANAGQLWLQTCGYDNNPSVVHSRNGTHHWSGSNHPTKKVKYPWLTIQRTDASFNVWKNADVVYDIYQQIKPNGKGYRTLARMCSDHLGVPMSDNTCRAAIWEFEDGWIPKNDPLWIKFKSELEITND